MADMTLKDLMTKIMAATEVNPELLELPVVIVGDEFAYYCDEVKISGKGLTLDGGEIAY